MNFRGIARSLKPQIFQFFSLAVPRHQTITPLRTPNHSMRRALVALKEGGVEFVVLLSSFTVQALTSRL
ncbi:hypothetical protein N7510_006017 [Penicillium lagena]|uniref:uncharacterized protein n=1 Tax=Penicillium lagena TaxID=94218 RepID=UPI002540D782|nr:uncharacterized protein N7510_006017 [Penicillium lagena]KAJ5612823.1 hypothetical protein N7510_006017 [Penicillium lagena]